MYIYYSFAAFDGNFKLKRYLKVGEKPDASLCSGRAYCVPDDKYGAWVRLSSAADQFTETPTCSGFQQQRLADVKGKAGVAVTGVGGGMCSRHEFIRPRSMVDFQYGER